MESENILEIEHLTKIYDGLAAVNGISFFIAEGEIVGLLGPNGAGKTTTINMILGLLEPTSGTIRIFKKDLMRHRREAMSRMNFAAAYAQLPGNLTVFQNLLIAAMLYGIPSPGQKVRALLAAFDLERFTATRTGFLSSGEQSRLLLAKSLLNEPKLLLLDEPTASLDPSASEIIRSRIKEYAEKQRAAILWTSHDMHEIEAVCSRVLFISKGRILLEGDPRELPKKFAKKNLEELFIAIAREPLSVSE